MRTTKSIFITFGAGSKNYIDAGKRLINQAKSTGYFDKTILYTDEFLRNDTQFWSSHSEFISNNKRGYGYWIWKSYIIKKTIETMNDGDILMYLDCGCEIGGEKELLIPTFFDYVKKDKIIGSFTRIEKNWNKMDLLIYLNMQNSELINKSQHQAGALLFYICKETRELVDKWYNIGCNYHMIDDSPSTEKNLECFEEHRHDQSIFSLLTKKYAIYSSKNLEDCVIYSRNKSGNSELNKESFVDLNRNITILSNIFIMFIIAIIAIIAITYTCIG